MTDPDDDIALGRALAAMRRRASLTQAQAGKLAEIGSKHLSALEQGHRAPSYKTLLALLRAYGASLGDLGSEIERGEGR
jgi:transcriptional regulator with XRE-family HTH domain